MSPIRILLLDDQPFARDERGIAGLEMEGASDAYFRMLSRSFQLLWLRTPAEMREYYYLVRALGERDSRALGWEGVVPEIVVFDFALTSRATARVPQEADRGASFPLPRLRSRLADLGADLNCVAGSAFPRPEAIGYEAGSDRFGCYAGGLTCLEFADYCCVGVPTTQYMSREETFFFEWFLERPLRGLFDKKSRGAPTWHELLRIALPELRERIYERLRAGTLRLDVRELLSMCSERAEFGSDERVVTLQSRFGRRQLGLSALFADCCYPDPSAADPAVDCSSAVAAWAGKCLHSYLSAVRLGRIPTSIGDLEEARAIAEHYWQAYISERCADRYQLSELAGKLRRTAEEELQLDELCRQVATDPAAARSDPENVRIGRGQWAMGHLNGACKSDLAARWATLFVAVRAEQHHRIATEQGVKLRALLIEEDKAIGEVYRDWLAERLGEDGLAQLMEELRMRVYRDGEGAEVVELPIRRAAEIDDVLIALDPLPSNLLTYLQKRVEADGRRAKDQTSLTNALKRLGQTAKQLNVGSDNNWGSLALSLADVLDGQPYICDWCDHTLGLREPPLGRHPQEGCSHGLRAGEGLLLKAYADELGFPEMQWPAWLKNAP